MTHCSRCLEKLVIDSFAEGADVGTEWGCPKGCASVIWIAVERDSEISFSLSTDDTGLVWVNLTGAVRGDVR